MNFGQNIKTLREMNGLTQRVLADKLGISMRMVGYMEKGYKKPSLELAMNMATVFGCSLDTLTGFKIGKEI